MNDIEVDYLGCDLNQPPPPTAQLDGVPTDNFNANLPSYEDQADANEVVGEEEEIYDDEKEVVDLPQIRKSWNINHQHRNLELLKRNRRKRTGWRKSYFASGLSPFKSFRATFYPERSKTWYYGPLFFEKPSNHHNKERIITGMKRKNEISVSKTDPRFHKKRKMNVVEIKPNIKNRLNPFIIGLKPHGPLFKYSSHFPSNMSRLPYRYLLRIQKKEHRFSSNRLSTSWNTPKLQLFQRGISKDKLLLLDQLNTIVKENRKETTIFEMFFSGKFNQNNPHQIKISLNKKIIYTSSWFMMKSRSRSEEEFWDNLGVGKNRKEASIDSGQRNYTSSLLDDKICNDTNTGKPTIIPPPPPPPPQVRKFKEEEEEKQDLPIPLPLPHRELGRARPRPSATSPKKSAASYDYRNNIAAFNHNNITYQELGQGNWRYGDGGM